MTNSEAYDCGLRSQGMDTEKAFRAFYTAYGIRSTTVTAPSSPSSDISYEYWMPESDPPIEVLNSFWNGYYNG